MSEIAKWYSGKHVFVTGATGFVGKCLIEKLLRDCPDIGDIYIIIRHKRAQSFEQRKHDYTQHIIFDQIRDRRPSPLDKIKIVEGDLSATRLGISKADREMIAKNVNIVFHSAADVHFDNRLVDAFYSNYISTKNLLEFATEFQRLGVSETMRYCDGHPA